MKSPSPNIPTTTPSASQTGRALIPWSSSSWATLATESSVWAVTTVVVMMSAAVTLTIHDRHPGWRQADDGYSIDDG
jgi:hypothetical protein